MVQVANGIVAKLEIETVAAVAARPIAAIAVAGLIKVPNGRVANLGINAVTTFAPFPCIEGSAITTIAVAGLIEVPNGVVANLGIGAITAGATRAALTTVSGGTAREVTACGICSDSAIVACAAGAAVAVAGLIEAPNSVVANLGIDTFTAGAAGAAVDHR